MALLERIGRYEVRAEIGRGGMSTIYAAHDPVFNRDVAIKVLPAELLHDPTFRTRFEREARTIASLEHPSIVPVYDFGEDHGQPYLVMRLMSGGSLSDRIKKGPMSLAETARIVSRIAPALDLAHRNGIVHRDLKPANILFDQNGEPYVVDFGIAKLSEAGATLTGSGIIGTPAYMSPEQARGESDIDGRSDIYSLGVTVFEMLAGRVPYESDAVMGQMVKHIVAPLPNILDLRADLPQDVQTIMIHALAKRKFTRYATAGEMAKALTAVAEGKPLPTEDGASTSSAMTGNTMDMGLEASGQERRVTPQPKKTPTPPPRKTPTPTRPVPPTSTYVSQKETVPAKKRSLILWGLLALVLVAAASCWRCAHLAILEPRSGKKNRDARGAIKRYDHGDHHTFGSRPSHAHIDLLPERIAYPNVHLPAQHDPYGNILADQNRNGHPASYGYANARSVSDRDHHTHCRPYRSSVELTRSPS